MAILFYDSISLDKQEIQDVSLQKLGSNPVAGADSYQGRIIFTKDSSNPTTAGTLSYFDGSDWINLDGIGAVTSVATISTGTSTGAPLIITPTTGAVTVQAMEYDGGQNIGYVPQGSGGTATLYLDGSGNWSTPVGGMTNWNIDGDSGPVQVVSDGQTVDILGGTKMTTVASASRTITINHDDTSRSDTTSAASPAFGATFTALTSITSSATGHVTGVNTATYTLPNYTDSNTTYTLPVVASGTANTSSIVLTGLNPTSTDTVSFQGTSAGIKITDSPGNNGTITLDLQDDVTIATSLTVGGTTTLGNTLDVTSSTTLGGTLAVTGIATFTEIPVIPSTLPTSNNQAANKAYVDDVLTGGVVFQGTYDASTVPGSPDLTSASSIAVSKGWAYSVDTAGTFFGEDVEVGDLLIANVDMASGASTLVKWSVLQNNVVEATDSIFGIAKFTGGNGFESAMTTAGEPKLADHSFTYTTTANNVPTIVTNSFGVVTAITDTPINIPSTQVSNFTATTKAVVNSLRKSMPIPTGGASTSPVTVTLNHALNNANLSVQVYNASTYDTAYPQISRTDNNNVAITFAQTPANNAFTALIF
jgi:hypothetical protein